MSSGKTLSPTMTRMCFCMSRRRSCQVSSFLPSPSRTKYRRRLILSPWSSVYEGNALKINVKTFLVPRLILTAGFGIWEKTYLNTLEQRVVASPFGPGTDIVLSTIFAERRQDDQSKLVLAARMPFASESRWFLEPFLRLPAG